VGVWREVGDRVFVRRYPFFDTNVMAIETPEGFVVVDTRTSHRQGQEILRELRELGDPNVRAVVNSHFHWDHVFGNHVFRPVEIWGHDRCAERVLANGDARRRSAMIEMPDMAEELAEVVIDPPDRNFSDRTTLELGRTIELLHLGRGHTDNDVIVHVPDAMVLFAGDLLEQGAPPFFGDSYPLDWPATIEAFLPLTGGSVVPGHGDVVDRAFVEAQLDELRTSAMLAREAAAGALTIEAAIDRSPFPGEPGRTAIERGVLQLRGEVD
jgi:glyoxylase-like metal-dependent hydrolase (beta-lactamase superfamily II)